VFPHFRDNLLRVFENTHAESADDAVKLGKVNMGGEIIWLAGMASLQNNTCDKNIIGTEEIQNGK
jgi:hypothetical protein